MPAELLPALRRTLWPLACMVPGWCHHVTVYYHPRGDGTYNASTDTEVGYRWASVFVHAGWLDNDERRRTEALAHELAHALLAPLADWTRDVLKKLVPASEAERFHQVLMVEQRERVEMVTQDVTYLFLARVAGEADRGKPHRQPARRRRR